jgi:hypothetical protein
VRVDEHEVGATRLQIRDRPVRGLEGRHLRPLDEHAAEHVRDANGYAGGFEEAPPEPGILLAEVGGTHHPMLLFEKVPVPLGVEGVVSEGKEVGDGEQGGAALKRDPTPCWRRILGVGNDRVEFQLLAQPWHEVEDRGAPRGSYDVPDEEQPEAQSNSPTARGR